VFNNKKKEEIALGEKFSHPEKARIILKRRRNRNKTITSTIIDVRSVIISIFIHSSWTTGIINDVNDIRFCNLIIQRSF